MLHRTLLAGGALLFAAACAESPTAPSTDMTGDLLSVQTLVDICHFDADVGEFFPITVSDNGGALEAHLSHGDGLPGEVVPGQEGFEFDADCVPTEIPQQGPYDFESGTLPGEWTTASPAGAEWFVSAESPIAGAFSAQSGDIADSQSTDLSIDLVCEPGGGLLRFRYFTSTEWGFDYLRVLVDDGLLENAEFSGLGTTGSAGYPESALPGYILAAGAQTVTFRYVKDGSVSSGDDLVRIDDVEFEGCLPA